jgi:fatty acid desaturase
MISIDEQSTTSAPSAPGVADDERERIRQRLEDRREFTSHLVAYVVVNAFLVGVWMLTDYGGYFWPAWVVAAWGVGLLLHAYETFFRRPITEADIDAELRRRR